jgi:ADP-ribose pyrophosphatase YjhB (NUDIX family)
MYTIGVFAIIFDDKKRVLFCHRTDRDIWNLPGGRFEKGETPWEGVIREVKEETGFNVEVKKLTGIYSKPHEDDVAIQFMCNVIGGEMKTNKEADKIRYFAFEEIPSNTVSKQVERVKDVIDVPDKIHLKKQIGKPAKQLIEESLL